MKKYNIKLSHSDLIEAKNEEEAVNKYFENNVECAQQTPTTFISENLNTTQVFLASELSGNALQTVLKKHSDINVEHNWMVIDETPELDMKELGFEINQKQMYWELEYPNRQLYFSFKHDGSGSREIGIVISDLNKLVEILKKDLKLPEKIVKALKNEDISLSLRTQYYGGGDGRTYFEFSDDTEKGIKDIFLTDEMLQKWFDENVINHLLEYFQNSYDYLTSEEAIIEALDMNEFLFTEDGVSL